MKVLWLCRGTFYTDYQILEELGQGAYGKAYRAQRLLVRENTR